MDIETLPVLSLSDPAATFASRIGESFRRYGFALVRDHGIDPELIASGWDLTGRLFALPDEEKRAYLVEGAGGARGYTSFGVEVAKGASARDLKEFWHVGRELPPGHRLEAQQPRNIWPARPDGFRPTFVELFAEFDRVGATLLSRMALDLGLPERWFDDVAAEGNSVLRLLHYPPVAGTGGGGAIRAGAHEDINLITLLLGAEEAGLELLTREGEWIADRRRPARLSSI